MALTPYADIKAEIMENLEYLKETPYPEDMIAELADSRLPIYNHEVIREWQELPDSACDQWTDYGYDTQKNEGGIIQLMLVDLTFYYLEEYNSVWQEIKESLESEDED
jgi:hypothetical protein